MSAFGGKADINSTSQNVRLCPKADIAGFGLDHFQSGSFTRYDDLVRRKKPDESLHVRCYWRRPG